MNKKSKKGKVGIGVILGGIVLLAGLQLLNAKVFDSLNPFSASKSSVPDKSTNISDLSSFELSKGKFPNDLSILFTGSWSVGSPLKYGDVTTKPLISCEMPLTFTSPKQNIIVYYPEDGQSVEIELSKFNNRVSWFPKDGQNSISEPKSQNVFWLYQASNGKVDWDNPTEYRRCF